MDSRSYGKADQRCPEGWCSRHLSRVRKQALHFLTSFRLLGYCKRKAWDATNLFHRHDSGQGSCRQQATPPLRSPANGLMGKQVQFRQCSRHELEAEMPLAAKTGSSLPVFASSSTLPPAWRPSWSASSLVTPLSIFSTSCVH